MKLSGERLFNVLNIFIRTDPDDALGTTTNVSNETEEEA